MRAPAGFIGGLWSTELFLRERGGAALYLPFDGDSDDTEAAHSIAERGSLRVRTLPAADLAVAVHQGPDSTVDLTYQALGEHVARHELSIEGRIRERYLTSESGETATEIGWPILRTRLP